MRIAIIPARSGSKRIPQKNIRLFDEIPMICHAINVAKKSNLFDRIVVTTDSKEIANLSISAGADVPFIRPLSLADDFTPTVHVISHAINQCETLKWEISEVCCIYPCVPFLNTQDLKMALEMYHKSDAKFCFAIAKYSHPIQRAMIKMEGDRLSPIFKENQFVRTQDLNNVYYDLGQFYWGKRDSWVTSDKLHENGIGYLIPSWRAIDIDDEDDWTKAELIYKAIKERGVSV